MRFILFILSIAVLLGFFFVGGFNYPHLKLQRSATNAVVTPIAEPTGTQQETLQLGSLKFKQDNTIAHVTQPSCGKLAIDFLFDTSISMNNRTANGRTRLQNVKTAVKNFVLAYMKNNYLIGAQEFKADRANIVKGIELYQTGKESFLDQVSNLNAGKITPTKKGFELAKHEIENAKQSYSGYFWVLIVMTDGSPNPWPDQDPTPIADELKQNGVVNKLITIGLSLGSKQLNEADAQELMRSIASTPSDFYDTDSSGQLEQVYTNIAQSICQ